MGKTGIYFHLKCSPSIQRRTNANINVNIGIIPTGNPSCRALKHEYRHMYTCSMGLIQFTHVIRGPFPPPALIRSSSLGGAARLTRAASRVVRQSKANPRPRDAGFINGLSCSVMLRARRLMESKDNAKWKCRDLDFSLPIPGT
jgi:hypothetical protein